MQLQHSHYGRVGGTSTHGTNKIYRKNRASCTNVQAVEKKKKSRREAIKTAKAKPIESLLHHCCIGIQTVLHCATVGAGCSSGSLWLRMGMILQNAIRSSGGGRRRKHGMEVDPTLADEEQLDEDIVSSKRGPDSPDLGICNESSRSPTVVPAAAPPARRGPRAKSLTLFKSYCPGRSNREVV
jgi:hypothetical protein